MPEPASDNVALTANEPGTCVALDGVAATEPTVGASVSQVRASDETAPRFPSASRARIAMTSDCPLVQVSPAAVHRPPPAFVAAIHSESQAPSVATHTSHDATPATSWN